MNFPIQISLYNKGNGRTVEGYIRRTNESDLISWAFWRYGVKDEDREWDWLSIYKDSVGPIVGYECYSAIQMTEVQGMMSLDLRGHHANQATYLVIDYLATNPSNRYKKRGFKNVGTALFGFAVARSQELG